MTTNQPNDESRVLNNVINSIKLSTPQGKDKCRDKLLEFGWLVVVVEIYNSIIEQVYLYILLGNSIPTGQEQMLW